MTDSFARCTLKYRLREYRKISRNKDGFRIAEIVSGAVPMWATHYLFQSVWDIVTQWGFIEVLPENHIVHAYTCLGEEYAAFGIEDYRPQIEEVTLALAVPWTEDSEFISQFDVKLCNGIIVRCQREMTPILLLDSILDTEELQQFQNYRYAGLRYARPLRERVVSETRYALKES